jgi:hypothetical protein
MLSDDDAAAGSRFVAARLPLAFRWVQSMQPIHSEPDLTGIFAAHSVMSWLLSAEAGHIVCDRHPLTPHRSLAMLHRTKRKVTLWGD